MASQAKSTVFEGEAPESDEEDLNGLASYKSESSVEAPSKIQTPETHAVVMYIYYLQINLVKADFIDLICFKLYYLNRAPLYDSAYIL